MTKTLISWVIRYVPRKYLQLFSHSFLKVSVLFYSGKNVTCNVCGKSFRKFLPYGRKARENALCPNCLALERHRLMWLFLKDKTTFFTQELKVLHVAPEHCFIDRFAKLSNLEYITGDLESPLAQVKMDIHQIPFADDSFDVVFCNHVLEHVQDDIQACREINRVLKNTGWGIIQSPVYEMDTTLEDATVTDPSERERLFGQRDHVRKYGRDYASRLSKSGLHVQENTFVKTLPEETIIRHALPPKEILFFCTKGT
ncbi:MAG: class I SAM-dependent methyltransferase [Lunatimonas sp.]|uniref:class I SAM-dependent methyltransferase n=1 Tax=Lunatimonas sp. TaxID=2060141 RepID=UPI00263B2483|nr:class I SAM-dependent methyltransferase [Lunatimonas sp.]MCC5937061.1 class I SAM-dependent methyltransferase [Lunatimonas sp.]